ncbi:uncharacterized protein RSE6_14182 [Rhynchosporium secalis]|uniref:Uncharacterized protein n=1 Tax=Rhynchosporium secalis TaxID=38038 RepID=A0A1E1MUM8_RHYSE|nr:uncharacterized protein RSE6_14182 [Rhynchosporium secalis]
MLPVTSMLMNPGPLTPLEVLRNASNYNHDPPAPRVRLRYCVTWSRKYNRVSTSLAYVYILCSTYKVSKSINVSITGIAIVSSSLNSCIQAPNTSNTFFSTAK